MYSNVVSIYSSHSTRDTHPKRAIYNICIEFCVGCGNVEYLSKEPVCLFVNSLPSIFHVSLQVVLDNLSKEVGSSVRVVNFLRMEVGEGIAR